MRNKKMRRKEEANFRNKNSYINQVMKESR